MVEFGSRHVPPAAWRRADALRLPFDDRQFDLVICQFGVMFFPDRPVATSLLRSGGHLQRGQHRRWGIVQAFRDFQSGKFGNVPAWPETRPEQWEPA